MRFKREYFSSILFYFFNTYISYTISLITQILVQFIEMVENKCEVTICVHVSGSSSINS